MGAHVVTFLIEIADGKNWNPARTGGIVHALDNSRIGDQLDLAHWEELHRLCAWSGNAASPPERAADATQQLKAYAITILPVYIAKWRGLGKPTTIEDWHAAQREGVHVDD